MSRVYIKGMEMPSCCDRCIYSGWSNFYQIYICTARWRSSENEALLFDKKHTNSVATMRSGRADNCPLVPVPDHGRLIDADALKESIKEARKAQPEIADVYDDDYFLVAEWLASAPTIIPASKEGEG